MNERLRQSRRDRKEWESLLRGAFLAGDLYFERNVVRSKSGWGYFSGQLDSTTWGWFADRASDVLNLEKEMISRHNREEFIDRVLARMDMPRSMPRIKVGRLVVV